VSRLELDKYEGTANDFVVLDLLDAEEASRVDPELAARLCDRHRGVGADGVLFVTRGDDGADARMVVVNADGSRPEMCGNGLRCVALHVVERGGAASNEGAREVVVDTDAGRKRCLVETRGAGAALVTVDMGRIVVGEAIGLRLGDRIVAARKADAGNPHAVTFDALSDDDLDALGADLQRGPIFPNGVNLERASVQRDGSIRVDVFERGVGRTMACGTGACAVAAVAVERGMAKRGAPITVTLAGGALEITLDDANVARMRGPARRVFHAVVASGLGSGSGSGAGR
jgi:diaminopimelate epimerase